MFGFMSSPHSWTYGLFCCSRVFFRIFTDFYGFLRVCVCVCVFVFCHCKCCHCKTTWYCVCACPHNGMISKECNCELIKCNTRISGAMGTSDTVGAGSSSCVAATSIASTWSNALRPHKRTTTQSTLKQNTIHRISTRPPPAGPLRSTHIT